MHQALHGLTLTPPRGAGGSLSVAQGAGTGTLVGLSTDGVTWTLISVATDADDLTDVACSAKASIAAGRHHVNADDEVPVAFWSADGETWQQVMGLAPSGMGLPYRVAALASGLALIIDGAIYASEDAGAWARLPDAGLPANLLATGIIGDGRDLLVVDSVPAPKADDIWYQSVSIIGRARE